jgi:hypothetical protein
MHSFVGVIDAQRHLVRNHKNGKCGIRSRSKNKRRRGSHDPRRHHLIIAMLLPLRDLVHTLLHSRYQSSANGIFQDSHAILKPLILDKRQIQPLRIISPT